MIIPIRCFTCGKVIGSKYSQYKKLISEKKDDNNLVINNNNIDKVNDNKEIFSKLSIDRYCCKRILLSHIDLYINI